MIFSTLKQLSRASLSCEELSTIPLTPESSYRTTLPSSLSTNNIIDQQQRTNDDNIKALITEKRSINTAETRNYKKMKWLTNLTKNIETIIHNLTYDDRYDNLILEKPTRDSNLVHKLIFGAYSVEEHNSRVHEMILTAQSFKGEAGLRALGFEYKRVPINNAKSSQDSNNHNDEECFIEEEKKSDREEIQEYLTKLHHIETDMPITSANRQHFIADGQLYEEVTRLCQEYAQEQMQTQFHLNSVLISDDQDEEPIRALVSPSSEQGLLIISTGSGKVRTGIFSRQHLLLTSLESATALPVIKEAHERDLGVIILDPNARGDKRGIFTFEQSLDFLMTQYSNPNLYFLAHSAAGAQLIQYCMERPHFYKDIKAIAFTDSTHNIQWTRNIPCLQELLQSPKCIYFRSSKVDQDSFAPHVGTIVDTDEFWKHRFGELQTFWAGTFEHSLTNWTPRKLIWEHFDLHLDDKNKKEAHR